MVEKIKKAKQKLRSPSAFTILFVVIIVMAALTWVVPSGLYKTNEDGNRIAGSYHVVNKDRTVKEKKDGKEIEVDKHDRQGLWDVFTAPIKGMTNKLDVIVFVMVLGGFLGVTMKTGALDASLGALLRKLKGKDLFIIFGECIHDKFTVLIVLAGQGHSVNSFPVKCIGVVWIWYNLSFHIILLARYFYSHISKIIMCVKIISTYSHGVGFDAFF